MSSSLLLVGIMVTGLGKHINLKGVDYNSVEVSSPKFFKTTPPMTYNYMMIFFVFFSHDDLQNIQKPSR